MKNVDEYVSLNQLRTSLLFTIVDNSAEVLIVNGIWYEVEEYSKLHRCNLQFKPLWIM